MLFIGELAARRVAEIEAMASPLATKLNLKLTARAQVS